MAPRLWIRPKFSYPRPRPHRTFGERLSQTPSALEPWTSRRRLAQRQHETSVSSHPRPKSFCYGAHFRARSRFTRRGIPTLIWLTLTHDRRGALGHISRRSIRIIFRIEFVSTRRQRPDFDREHDCELQPYEPPLGENHVGRRKPRARDGFLDFRFHHFKSSFPKCFQWLRVSQICWQKTTWMKNLLWTMHFSRHVWWHHTWVYFMPSLESNFGVLLLIILHTNEVAWIAWIIHRYSKATSNKLTDIWNPGT